MIQSQRKDGGLGFPSQTWNVEQQDYVVEEGATLRDLFAMSYVSKVASMALLNDAKNLAISAYKVADAMLEARKNQD